jgi:hypothetical protein
MRYPMRPWRGGSERSYPSLSGRGEKGKALSLRERASGIPDSSEG